MGIKLSLVELGAKAPHWSRSQAISEVVNVAQYVESIGFNRIWLAEHHNTNQLLNKAPEVMIPLIASKTNSIRVGSGSVLLNHYSPFKIAEVFSLMADMFPNRIDMGIGRATTGPLSDIALQRNRSIRQTSDDSAEQLVELLHWMHGDFDTDHPFGTLKVGCPEHLPEFWLLGSSSWSAQAAGSLGLNYAFAGFINPGQASNIINLYRAKFEADDRSLTHAKPKVILALSLYCGDTYEAAVELAAPHIYMMQELQKGKLDETICSGQEAMNRLGTTPSFPKVNGSVFPHYLIGTPDSLKGQLEELAASLEVEELMIQCISTDIKLRYKSFDLLAKAFGL